MRNTDVPRPRLFLVAILATLLTVLGLAAPAAAVASGSGTSSSRTAPPVVVGFGDSVAGGWGAGLADPSSYGASCERTLAAYPVLLGGALHASTTNLACRGASAPAGLSGPQAGAGSTTVPAQLAQAKTLGHIDIATLTIGANDVKWVDWLTLCASPLNCATATNTATFRLLLAKASLGIASSLTTMVYGLKVDRTVLTGYYDPLGSLVSSVPTLTAAEVSWYRARLAELNGVLRAEAVLFPHVKFAPVVLDASAGDVILVGPTGQIDTGMAGFLHPSLLGQSKIAQAVGAVVAS